MKTLSDYFGLLRNEYRKQLLVNVAIILSTLLTLTWLYFHSAALTASPQNLRYNRLLLQLAEFNAQADTEMLATRLRLSQNYDALTRHLQQTRDIARLLVTPPAFLTPADTQTVKQYAQQLLDTVQRKQVLIDQFRRKNSVLLNSSYSFQKLAESHLHQAEPGKLSTLIHNYVRHTLFLLTQTAITPRGEWQQHKQQLIDFAASAQQRRFLDELLLHGDLIFNNLSVIDRLIEQTRQLPVYQQRNDLLTQYQQGLLHAQKTARYYRIALYAIALLLVAYLLYAFWRLGQTRRSLSQAHKEVTHRYRAQKRAEKSLLLHSTAFDHAHDGITLTDARGNILDINPAFSRITGYSAQDVMGKNPRILKSGRHDAEFYRQLWKTIEQTGSWQGEIWNRNKQGEVYPEYLSIAAIKNMQGDITNFVAVFTDIKHLKQQEAQLRQMAYYDTLTGLPNRALLTDRLNQAMAQCKRNERMMAVCFLDLDQFKPINDQWGHEAGDTFLVELANQFRVAMRQGDTVARLGGDEFVFLLLGMQQKEDFTPMIHRLMQVCTQTININNQPISVTASIGVTFYPQDEQDADTLLRHADQAMYTAKQHGRNQYHFFDPAQDQRTHQQLTQITEIKQALQQQQFVLYYQPKVDLQHGKVYGMEALIRWQHPERGLVSPLEFLPLIEDHELIVELGNWVLHSALEQLQDWTRQGLKLSVSINVSSRQLQQNDFVESLRTALSQCPDVVPSMLEIEILETAALEDISSVSRIINQCRALGIHTSLDDFGTGYSSLIYLKRLPASLLKIDQSFVRNFPQDSDDLAIIQAVLALARAFDKQVIAEGVETIEHGEFLMQLGCHYAQGYGIAKPMPASEVKHWISQWAPAAEWQSLMGLGWSEDDQQILVAHIQHNQIISKVRYSVENHRPIPKKYLADHQHCGFGQWYFGNGQQRFAELDSFNKINAPHQHGHTIIGKINTLLQMSEFEQANKELNKLLDLRATFKHQLRSLLIAIAQDKP